MEKQILKGKINPSRTQKLQSKRHLAHHVAAISDEGGRSESWWEHLRQFYVCAKVWLWQNQPWRVRTRYSGGYQQTRKNSARWIFTHTNTGQIVPIDFSCNLLLITKIFKGFTKIESLLPGLAGGNKFGFGGRQRDIVLTATFPRDRSAIHHKDVASVWVAGISVISPFWVNPAPEFWVIRVSGATSVCNRLIASVTQIL